MSEPTLAAVRVAQELIAERRRQDDGEGFNLAHDDSHGAGELSLAAACYAFVGGLADNLRAGFVGFPPSSWPWAPEWWKPKDRRRDLVRAGALIIAEIERLDRVAGGAS